MKTKLELYTRINQLFHKAGYDFRRFPTSNFRLLSKYLADNNVNDCFDVGANIGQYAKYFRSTGFKGNIYSFEPQSEAFKILTKKASGDSKWKTFNFGLGSSNEKSVINISKNSVSSSILDINACLLETAPETEYVSKEEIEVKRLDSFVKEINFQGRFFLKMDAQGFESKILEGALGCFDNIYALQLESSCIPLYKEEKLFDEMKRFIESKGFYLSSLESGFSDPNSGRLLQAEMIFLREA